ncbi:2-hydroxyacid dehydrogenase [Flavobacterium psychrophilum]|uniref:2-hydroxyacid dehydrogenase n=1 Tax=Flavobacterium psychrophilum TaxID=96345 RepID=UPI00090CA987|nr:2-hydroxyacid dehydrogenase [Flavobacterium psychrophilum]EKT2072602.1 2-hydroxyacid dehydrogenase [Flavobacterium psychrophilum]EKT4492115.1 2-hydroxyacid dehydrogenase [Flavobacterium psychrophilum]SHH93327.1 Putative D-isomer specific 2-hydroxyacid dehydrogenase, NAD-binding [Flavobacterium psychrophilum]
MKVAIFGTQFYERDYLNKCNNENKHELVFFDESLNSETTHLAIGFKAVCVFVTDKVDKNCIDKLAKLGVKLIDLRSAGYNNVEIESARENNIKVLRVPAYSPQAVAEHAVALILTLNRKTNKAYNQVRENNFSLQKLMGFNLYGKTIGVVGTGKIGRAFCTIMLGFGCKIIAFDIKENEQVKRSGVHFKTFDELLSESDIISIHCPLTPKTNHLFNKKTFDKIKKGAMIINTSRGAIINTEDAISALKLEQIGYLGIDVYEDEGDLFFKDRSQSIIQDDVFERLLSFHNVLITPHQAFYTQEAVTEIAKITIKNFSDFEENKVLENEVKI